MIKKIDIGDSIQILANLGVIAGIIFLAIEVRQTNLATQSATRQAISASIENRTLTLANSPQLLEVWIRSFEPGAITAGSVADIRLHMLYASLLTAAEESYLQFRDRNINSEFFEARAKRAIFGFQSDHSLKYLKQYVEDDMATPEFKDWLDRNLGDRSPFRSD